MTTEDDSFPEYPTSAPTREPVSSADTAAASTQSAGDSLLIPTSPDSETTPTIVATDAPVAPSAPEPNPESSPNPSADDATVVSSIEEESSAEEKSDTIDVIEEVDASDSDSAHDVKKESNEKTESHATSAMQRITSTIELRLAALRARIEKREAKLERVMESARNRGTISNDDIVRLLHVSDKSATRYANILVVRRNLLRTGKGRGTRYTVAK